MVNNVELLMQYITYLLMAIGGLAFVVAVIVQVIKELPCLNQIQTSVVALAVSMILCPLVVVIVCQCLKIVIVWYYVFASFNRGFYRISGGDRGLGADHWHLGTDEIQPKIIQIRRAGDRPPFAPAQKPGKGKQL